MRRPVLIIPGIGNSGPQHWQSLWQQAEPGWRRLRVADWEQVQADDWLAALEREVAELGVGGVLVAHSLGCLTVAQWAAQSELAAGIAGALLVAPPDPQGAAFPAQQARGFLPAREPLPFPALVLASSDDPYSTIEKARDMARAWAAEFQVLGPLGHLNAASGLGEWPQGRALLNRFGA